MYTMLHVGSVLAVLIITFIVVLFRMMISGGEGAPSNGGRVIGMGSMLHDFTGISRVLLFFLGVVLVGGLTGAILVPSLQAFRRTSSWYGVLDPTLFAMFLAQVAYSLTVCSVSEFVTRGGGAGAFLLGVGSGRPGTLAVGVGDEGGTTQDEKCSGSSEQSSSSSHRENGNRNGDGIVNIV